MNDTELNRLLDLWEAPTPSRLLREDVRARFPRAERLGFVRPLRWALATVLTAAALAIALAGAVAIAQSHETLADLPVIRPLSVLYQYFLDVRQAERAKSIALRIAASDPKVFVDGRAAAPLQFSRAHTMDVQIPGDGLYSITTFPIAVRTADDRPTGWIEAGHISGNVIEFKAGARQVRIECSKAIVDRDGPVFVMRR